VRLWLPQPNTKMTTEDLIAAHDRKPLATILCPSQSDQGAPYVEVTPPNCQNCGRPIKITERALPLGRAWTYECWCGWRIYNIPVPELN